MKKLMLVALFSMAAHGSFLAAMNAEKAVRLNVDQFEILKSLVTEEGLKGFIEETETRFPDTFSSGMPDTLWSDLDGVALQWIVDHAEVIKDEGNYRSQDLLRHDLDMLILNNRIERRSMKDVSNIIYVASFLGIQPVLDAFRSLFANPTRISSELLELAIHFKDIEFANYSQLLIGIAGSTVSKEGKLAMIELLLHPRLKVDLSASDQFGETALSRAVGLKDCDVAGLLLRSGVNPNIRGVSQGGQRQSAPLWIAYYNLDTSMMRLLLEWKADVNATDSQGQTLLMAAIRDGRTFLVWPLFTHKIDVNVQDKDQVTALMKAAGKTDTDLVKDIIEQGIKDIDCTDQWGETALCWAVRSGTTAIVQLLLEAGADARFKNNRTHKTVLELAVDKASETDEARQGIVDLLKTHLQTK